MYKIVIQYNEVDAVNFSVDLPVEFEKIYDVICDSYQIDKVFVNGKETQEFPLLQHCLKLFTKEV